MKFVAVAALAMPLVASANYVYIACPASKFASSRDPQVDFAQNTLPKICGDMGCTGFAAANFNNNGNKDHMLHTSDSKTYRGGCGGCPAGGKVTEPGCSFDS